MIGFAGGLLGIGLTWLGLRGIENLFSAFESISKLVKMDWVMVLGSGSAGNSVCTGSGSLSDLAGLQRDAGNTT